LEEEMQKITRNQLITILFTLATIAINALANILPINGQNTGEISDRFDVLFVPAGYVFSIWGVIYLGWMLYAVYQALPAQADNAVLNRIAPYYWLTSLANSAWILLWHYEQFVWTLPAMLVILGALIVIYTTLKRTEEFNAGGKLWFVTVPFSLYLGWVLYAVYQALSAQADNAVLNRIAPYYWLTSLANSAWILLWHYEQFVWTLPAMLVILAALIVIYTTLKKSGEFDAGGKLWFVTVPFSLYLGWISVATVANVSQLLVYLGWNGWGISPEIWTMIMLLVASALGIAMALRFSAAAYGLVLVWAFYGIAYKHPDIALVANSAYIGIALVAAGIIAALIIRYRNSAV